MPVKEYQGNNKEITIPSRLWFIDYGMAKAGKTAFAVSCPEPLWIAELDCNEDRLKYVLDKHASGKAATYDVIASSNQLGLSEGECEELIGRTEAIMRMAKSAGEGTLILDGANTLYRLYQLKYTKLDWSAGKPQDVSGKEIAAARANFALINNQFDTLVKPMRDLPNLNGVFTTEPSADWANGQSTGTYSPRGPDSWEFLFDIELFTFVTGGLYDATKGGNTPVEYHGSINWSAYRDDRLRGKTIKDPTYDKVRMLLS